MKKLFSFLPLLVVSLFSTGQSEECGTTISSEDNAIIQQFIAQTKTNNLKALGDSIVPIKFHIIGYNTGSNAIDSATVFDELALINSFYTNAGIEFEHCGNIEYINDSEYAIFEKYTDEVICDANDVQNVLNIYFVPYLYKVSNGDTIALCGYAYSTSLTKNRIIMKNSCSANGSTLAHEIGHYFSLAHTHTTSLGAELVNGSNCSTAGDRICDTPADPQLSTTVVNTSCIYTGTAQDANNDFYNPEVRNIMSYSRKSCRDIFSPDQYARMNTYLINYRNYLLCPSFVSVQENNTTEFSIAPNPTSSESFLSIKNYVSGTQLVITDLSGKLIYQGKLPSQSKIEVSQYVKNSGAYFISIHNKYGSSTKKLIKY